jgi:peptide/nickel transport system ATP-binding protein/oligopeptide transport system ATP-binding protein
MTRPVGSDAPLLEVDGLRTVFASDDGEVQAVNDVSFSVDAGETLGIVGESGCGKSVTALSILRLVPSPPGRIAGGEIRYRGTNLLALDDEAMRRLRGNDISMVFQEPMTALNPVYTVGNQIMEAIRLHQGVDGKEARKRAIAMLVQVGIPSPEQRVDEYPHQLSGGMRQRVMIAMALSCNPSVLIADEPTTALDVTIQAQILELLRDLQEEREMAILLITHDLGVVAENADRVVVMYAGKIVEATTAERLFAAAAHPYAIGLLESMPRVNERRERLSVIPGAVPPPTAFPSGCAFHPRCPFAEERCTREEPVLEPAAEGHTVRCHRWREIPALRAEGVSFS